MAVMWIRSDPDSFWVRGTGSGFGIQMYKITDKMKGKAKVNQQKHFFCRNLYFSSLNLKKVGADVC